MHVWNENSGKTDPFGDTHGLLFDILLDLRDIQTALEQVPDSPERAAALAKETELAMAVRKLAGF